MRGSVRLYLPHAFFVHHNALTIPGRGMDVNGVVTPYVPGQHVTLLANLGSRRVARVKLALKPSRNHHFSYFSYRVTSRGADAAS